MGGKCIIMKKQLTIKKVAINIVYAILAFVWLIPIYYLLITTFKTPEEATLHPMGFPQNFTFSNYIKAFNAMHFPRAFANNVYILIVSVTLIIIMSSMAAYVIARSEKKLYAFMYNVFIIGLIIPFQIAIIPLYKIMTNIHMMDKLTGVVIVNVFCINLAFAIFLFKGFVSTVPKELEEAAVIDGCGTFRIFCSIIFPILKPIIATVSILVSLSVWNQFFTPLLLIQNPKKAVLLQEVSKNVGPFATDWTSFFPMLVLSVLPLVILYLIMQKHIIEGVVAGSLKG